MSERRKAHWTIASARQNLPTLVGLAAREPQEIYRRNTLVARVVGPEQTLPHAGKRSLGEAFAELRQLCADERYTLRPGVRRDRPNPFLTALAEDDDATAPRKRPRSAPRKRPRVAPSKSRSGTKSRPRRQR